MDLSGSTHRFANYGPCVWCAREGRTCTPEMVMDRRAPFYCPNEPMEASDARMDALPRDEATGY